MNFRVHIKKLIWVSLILLSPMFLAAQVDCEDLIRQAEELKDTDPAGSLQRYLLALNCNSGLSVRLAPKITESFDKIIKQKDRIESQKNTIAQKQRETQRALEEVKKQKDLVTSLNDLRSHLQWGDLWFDNKKWEKAEGFYAKAAAIDSIDPYIKERLKVCRSEKSSEYFKLLGEIRHLSMDPEKGQFNAELRPKKQIYLEVTVGNPNPIGVIRSVGGQRGAIGSAYYIAGKPKKATDNFKDGEIFQAFPHYYWAYHIGRIRGGKKYSQNLNKELSSGSVSIGICNWGALKKTEKGTFVPAFYPGIKISIPKEEVLKLAKPLKLGRSSYNYVQKFTLEQLISLRKLLEYLTEIYDIPRNPATDLYQIDTLAYLPTPGIYTKMNVRNDKWFTPSPQLDSMLSEFSGKELKSEVVFYEEEESSSQDPGEEGPDEKPGNKQEGLLEKEKN